MTALEELVREFPERSELISFQWDAGGTFNDEPFDGALTGVYSKDLNRFRARMDFNDHPLQINGLVTISSCSIICVSSCCLAAKAVANASNLLSVLGDTFRAEADYTVVGDGDPANIIGSSRQRASCTIDRSGERPHGIGTVEVHAQGIPTQFSPVQMIQHSPGYAVYLRQVDKGFIEGHLSYPYLEDRTSGRPVGHVMAVRRYFYDSGRELPLPQVQTYYVYEMSITVKNGRRIIDFSSSSYYTPLEPVPAVDLAVIGATV